MVGNQKHRGKAEKIKHRTQRNFECRPQKQIHLLFIFLKIFILAVSFLSTSKQESRPGVEYRKAFFDIFDYYVSKAQNKDKSLIVQGEFHFKIGNKIENNHSKISNEEESHQNSHGAKVRYHQC